MSHSFTRLLLAALLAALLLASACVRGPTPTLPIPTATPVAVPALASALLPSSPRPPRADPYELARRLKGVANTPPVAPSPGYSVGHRQDFTVLDLTQDRYFTASAVLRAVTPRTYLYFEEGIEPPDLVDQFARRVEEVLDRVLPEMGVEWRPGIDGDSRLSILHARIPGVAGYFSAADNYPRAIRRTSNERLMLYINVGAVPPDSTGYYSVLAHELQHLVHWWADPDEETWVTEGLSEWMSDRLGYPQGVTAFQRRPDISLVNWPLQIAQTGPYYEGTYLFFKFLLSRYARTPGIHDLVTLPEDGVEGVNAYLRSQGQPPFSQVLSQWAVASYLARLPGQDTYPGLRLSITPGQVIEQPGSYPGAVGPYGSRYLEVRLGGKVSLDFRGERTSSLLPTKAPSGSRFWWSNRGDSVNPTLTREFDLRGLQKATLSFRTWYELEDGWDFAYLSVSTDEGQTWSILTGKHTTTRDPLGNSYGPGYTGNSGGGVQPAWAEETVDLTPHVGSRIWLRFEQVTDDAINGQGFAVDDVAIPELGFADDAEADRGWSAQGFLRSDNLVEPSYLVQVIEVGPQVRVRPVPLDIDRRGYAELEGLGGDTHYAVVVVTGIAELTTQPLPYQLTVRTGGTAP